MYHRYYVIFKLAADHLDEKRALGEDRVAILRGRRPSAVNYLWNSYWFDRGAGDGKKFIRRPMVTGSGCLSGGGGFTRKSKGRRPIVSYQNVSCQTDPYHRVLPPQSAHNDPRLPTLPCQARDIQLTPPITLAEASRPGARFSRQGKLSQTPLDWSGPDLLTLAAAIDALDDAEENTPKIKLNLWAPDRLQMENKEERDGEWLEANSDEFDTEEEEEEEPAVAVVKKKSKAPAESRKYPNYYPEQLLKSLRLLFFIMGMGGRWPFKTRVGKEWTTLELERHSWKFVYFILTSAVHFYITAISLLVTFTFLYSGESEGNDYQPPVYIQVQRLEFDKYWEYAFWTYIMALYVTVWNLFFLIDGMGIRGLFNRWFRAVTKMQYEPTSYIGVLSIWCTTSFIIYAIGLTICCFTDVVPAVRGSAGLIGSLFFSNFYPKIRFTRYFFLVRFFGLLFHLYTVYAMEVAMVIFLSCAKLIENSAKNWTLRFAMRFHLIGRDPKAKYRVLNYTMGVPFWKLLMEQQVITSFSRHTAAVFHGFLNTYLVTMGLQITLFIYRSLTFLLVPDLVRFDTKYVKGAIGESGDIIPYKDSDAQRHVTCFFITAMVIISWFTTSLSFINPGEMILRCARIVNRYELIICRGVKERRFVQTLGMQFGPLLNYTMRACGSYDRRTILNLFLWILAFSLGLLSFSPFNLQKHAITICTPGVGLQEPSCVTVMLARNERPSSGKDPIEILGPVLPPTVRATTPLPVTTPTVPETTTIIPETTTIIPETTTIIPETTTITPETTTIIPETTTITPETTTIIPETTTITPETTTIIPETTTITPETTTIIPETTTIIPETTTIIPETTTIIPETTTITPETTTIIPETTTITPETTTIIPETTTITPETTTIIPETTTITSETTTIIPETTTTIPETTTIIPEPTTIPTASPVICVTTWFQLPEKTKSPTNVLTSELVACDSTGKIIPPFAEDHCARDENVAPYASKGVGLFECSDNSKAITEVDQCGNIRLGDAKKAFVGLVYGNEKNEASLICASCYDYAQFPGNAESLKYCHMQSSEQAKAACATNGAQVSHSLSVTDMERLGVECIRDEFIITCPVDSEWKELQGTDASFVRIIKLCGPPGSGGSEFLPYLGAYGGECFTYPPGGGVKPADLLPYGNQATTSYTCATKGDSLDFSKRDSCGNLAYFSSADGIKRIFAKPIILKFADADFLLACCYDYYFMEGNEESIKFCHMRTKQQAESICSENLAVGTTIEEIEEQITPNVCANF